MSECYSELSIMFWALAAWAIFLLLVAIIEALLDRPTRRKRE